MMSVVSAQAVDMQCHLGVVDEALEKLVQQVHIKITDAGPRVVCMIFKAGTSGEIDDHARQRFVERYVGMSIAANTALVTNRPVDCLAQRDADILYRMMCVDMQIALRPDLDIQHAVTGNLVQHVVEKGHTRLKGTATASVEVDGNADLGLQRVPTDFCLAL